MSQPIMLVVDDEPLIRMCAAEFALEAGFEPLEASNADEALVALENRDDVSMLFTDVAMPGAMDGLALARHVKARWPRINVMIATGATTRLDEEFPHLAKPYGLGDFLKALDGMKPSS
ncbi:MAG TPA: response regulator [Novosphingobium sp.]|nr:response regulator [Novosphingobium sp.]